VRLLDLFFKDLEMNKLVTNRSGGPKTSVGRSVCSRNALKSGTYSSKLVIDGEDETEFEALCNDLIQDEKPQNTVQHILILKLAEIQWRVRRLDGYEATIYRQLRAARITTHEWANHLGFNSQEVLAKARLLTDSDIKKGPDMYREGLSAIEAVFEKFPTKPPDLQVLKQAHGYAFAVLRSALSISDDALAKALAESAADETEPSFWLRAKTQSEGWLQSYLDAFDAQERVESVTQAIIDTRIREHLLEGRHTRPMQELYRIFFKTLGELRKEQAVYRGQKAVLIDPVQSDEFVREKSEELIAEVT